MKKLLAWILCLSLILTLAACGSSGSIDGNVGGIKDTEETKESTSSGETEGTRVTEPTETQEPTRGVWLPTEKVKTVHNEEGDSVWRETYTYDLQGNMVSKTQYKPDGTVNYTCTMEYDEKGRLIRETSDGGSVSEYAYDSLGYQYLVGYNGTAYTLELDHVGRAVRYEDSRSTYTYTYADDMTSYIRCKLDDNGEQTEYTEYQLDDQGHIVTARRCQNGGNLLYRTDYVYENGLLVQELDYEMGSDTHVTTANSYTYDQYGNMLTDTFDGNYYSPDYDAVYTITEVTVTESAAQRLGQ